MLRFPKDKVLYMTLESNLDCSVGVSMTHNKKDAPDMTVASVYSSQPDMGGQVVSQTSLYEASPRSETLEQDAEALEKKAQ